MNKKHIIISVAVIVIAILAFAIVYFVSAEAPHTDPSGFGEWGQLYQIELTDGTIQPLESIFYQSNQVANVHYYLSAKSDVAGEGTIDVNLNDYGLTFQIGTETYVVNSNVASGTFLRNGEFQEIMHLTVSADDIVYELGLVNGTYTLQMLPTGSLKYDSGSGFEDSTLPSSASVEITVGTGSDPDPDPDPDPGDDDITVTFDTDVIWS